MAKDQTNFQPPKNKLQNPPDAKTATIGDENRTETDKIEWHATNKYPLVCVIVTHQNGARLIWSCCLNLQFQCTHNFNQSKIPLLTLGVKS